MNVKSVLMASLLVVFAAGSLTVRAADDAATTAKPAAADQKAEKAPVKKKAKRHSHVTEKTGVPATDPSPTDEPKKPLHDHMKEHK